MSAGDAVEDIAAAIPVSLPEGRRFVVAIAGPPAAGKSTLAERLRLRLQPNAVVLGLDAFHYDDAILVQRGQRDCKGAPETFDVHGYRRLVSSLRDHPDEEFSIPVFDRTLEMSRNCAEVVTERHRILITEGNYLLLNTDPWRSLYPLFDVTVFVCPSPATIEERIIDRWLTLGHDLEEARRRADHNDLPNARFVVEHSLAGALCLD